MPSEFCVNWIQAATHGSNHKTPRRAPGKKWRAFLNSTGLPGAARRLTPLRLGTVGPTAVGVWGNELEALCLEIGFGDNQAGDFNFVRHFDRLICDRLRSCPTSANRWVIVARAALKRESGGNQGLILSPWSKKADGLWHVCLPPTRRPDWLVVCGVSQRLEIKALKFFRFSDHPLLLSVSTI
jgi:hypothetical protein